MNSTPASISLDLQTIAEIDIYSQFQRQIVLAPYTTWGVGGAAAFFLEPATPLELVAAYHWAWQHQLPFVVIGKGSNILVDDQGINGVVVCMKNSMARFWQDQQSSIFTAEAGCHLAKLALAAARSEMAGFEFLICIPGTVGGAIAINAGVGGRDSNACIKSILLDVTVLNPDLLRSSATERNGSNQAAQISLTEFCDRAIVTIPASELDLSYRHSNLNQRHQWILSARFYSPQTASRADILAQHRAILQKRVAKQPLNQRTSGSTFKQPTSNENNKPAGWYIDQAGLKGYQIGGASISAKHANWIENDGTATAQDIKNLIAHVQQVVADRFDVQLEREVRFLPQDLITN
ncbi:UDP-N-acetylmuramate dehydrogenase [Thalassoporum mexicanum PCC 7367]|uniref:UDP-N-acetylmuramate dehydrogenase n=1 Tax=Thalassoporum mexicanum TaxID=3457544 RepID=UPI00029FA658|nr:FAD-binding protein [Pseudanabaena sp. PCC 7367]AFY69421.1 UDP-N-acetylmuramate dehydrogenase [Pseudanabaena sp. PCC 7367]